MIKHILFLVNFLFFLNVSSQTNISGIINKYSAVSNVDLCKNQFVVDTASFYSVGDSVLLIQMKGATMDTTNSAAYGNLLSLNDAGKFEYNIVATITGNVITFANVFQTPYNAANIIQVVSIPQYAGNVNVNAALTARPWNGAKGGILIFKVSGDLTLNANINVSGRGFRAGINTFLPPSAYTCNFTSNVVKYACPTGSVLGSGKGEGISAFYAGYESGRGKQINGGGGGNDHNSGGGGGAGYGAGGIGGRNNEPSFGGCKGYNPGIGGQLVSATTRFIFSGAGGAGHGNNFNTAGANAGGLIVISANNIIGIGSNRKIMANGNDATFVYNDGAGGGGGAGSIFLNSVSNTNLNLQAKGGKGANMNGDNSARCQGPGGGGGGGLILALTLGLDSLFVQGGNNGIVVSSTSGCNLSSNASLRGDTGLISNTNAPAMFNMGAPFISDLPLLSSLPDTVAICPNSPVSFVIVATGGNPIKTFQWQLKPSASSVWTNLTNGAVYNGTNTDSLTILNPTAALNANQYRVLVFTPCDSVYSNAVYLKLLPISINNITANICVGSSYTLPNGTVVNTAGTYIDTLQNISGCDSIFTVNLTTSTALSSTVNTTICSNETYTLPDGNVINTAGIYLDTLQNASGCDSVVTTNLTVNLVSSNTINASICSNETYTLPNGSVVNTAGTYIDTLQNVNTCDSVVTTILVINSASSSVVNATICSDETYTLSNGTIINTAGTYSDTLQNINTCDSVITIILAVNSTSASVVNATICSNENYTLPNGSIVNTAGTYSDTLQNTNDCDSVITTNLAVNTSSSNTINATICASDSYTLPNGNIVNTAGTYIDTLQNINTCDSVITTNLTVNPNVATTVNAVICVGSSYTLPNGSIVNTAGTYLDTLQAVNTCDSVITTNLTTSTSLSSTINATICSNETYTLPDGNVINTAGIYLDTLQNASGCDSVITTNLAVNLVSASTVNASICTNETYTLPDGSVVNTAGIYLDTLQNANACDSVITTNLVVSAASASIINVTICSNENYTLPNGSIVNTAGTYSDTLQNTNACDSIVTTNLAVNLASASTTNATICANDSYTLPNGNIVNSSGTYLDTLQNVNACDSIITTNLIVNPNVTSTVNAVICLGSSYTLPNGSVVNTAGTYLDTLQNINSCDSVITTNLTTSSSLASIVNASICGSENYILPNGTIVNTAGTYLDTLQNLNGCDSIVTTNLVVNTASVNTISDTICGNENYTLPSGTIVNTAGTYIDTLQNVNACDSIITTILLVNPIVVINVQPVNSTECLGNDVVYFVTASNATSYQWQINIGSGFVNMPSETNDSLSLIAITTIMDGNQYRCLVSNTCGTVTSNTANLNVSETAVIVSEPNDVVICPEGPGFSFDLVFEVQNVSVFQWQIDTGLGFQNVSDVLNFSGSNTNTLTISVPYENVDDANFRLNYTSDCGFGATSNEYNVRISEPDPVNGIDDVTFCLENIELIEVDYNGTNYTWNDAAQTTGRFLAPEKSGEYIVSFLQNSSSCLASDTINIVLEDCIANCVVTAPTGFSPNASGKNDEFKAIYTCSLDYFELVIANRWGEIVYFSNNPKQAWDGKYKNKPAPIGNYAWYIKYNKEGENKQQSVSGNVMLIR